MKQFLLTTEVLVLLVQMNICAPAGEPDEVVQDIKNELTTLDETVTALKNAVDYCTTSLRNLSKSLDEVLSDLADKAADWLSTISKAGDQLAEEVKKAEEEHMSTKSVDAAPMENSIEQSTESPEDNLGTGK